MAGKGLSWTAAHLRAATSPDDVRQAIGEARTQLGEAPLPVSLVVAALEELALDATRARLELKNATRLREILLASIAHDLRNPLNTFAMSAGLLRDDIESSSLDKSRALSLVGRMERASTRMQGLIEDLLEASRIEAGSIEVGLRPEQGAAVVRAAIEKARPLVVDKGARLEEGPVEDDAPLDADRAHLVDGLVKLITVALKGTADGGIIRLGVERADDQIRFTIRATNALRGVSGTSSHDENRGGLGLLIGRGLVAAQGGEVTTEIAPAGPSIVASFPART